MQLKINLAVYSTTLSTLRKYGGNPVACAAVLAVLSVLKTDDLLNHSQQMGKIFNSELNKLKNKHKCIGDVRGIGMFWGIDLVKDKENRTPDKHLANTLTDLLRNKYGILISADGPYSNVLKIKPPMCFTESDLYEAVRAIDHGLNELMNYMN